METIVWATDPPALRSPVMVTCFSGWNDAASAASTALEAVAAPLETELIAHIDPEDFYDFQANRPTIRVSGGVAHSIEWPANAVVAARAPAAERDLILINGTEPSTRWRSFCGTVIDIAERCNVEQIITFGSLIADVAHTRPVPITGLATDAGLIQSLGFEEVVYEGPTGVVGVLHHACRARGVSAASLWAAVPHYAAAVPNPKAALALLRRLEALTGVPVEAAELEEASVSFERQVSQAVEANPEIKEMVGRLEEQQDEVSELPADVPSGDALAKEFQKYLEQQE